MPDNFIASISDLFKYWSFIRSCLQTHQPIPQLLCFHFNYCGFNHHFIYFNKNSLKKNMKILFVSDTYYPHRNGVYYFVCRVAPLLQLKGHQVAVIAPSETIYSTLKKIDDIDVYGIPSLPTLYYPNVRFPIPLKLETRIAHILNIFKPDIIHIQDHFSIAKAIVKAGKKANIPIIGTNHFMTENLTSFVRYEKWKKRLSTIMWSHFSNIFNQISLVTTP